MGRPPFWLRLIAAAALPTLLTSCSDDAPNVSIQIVPSTGIIASADTLRFHAVVRDRGGAEISGAEVHWTTSDTVITVDATGLATARFTAVAKNVVVTATTDDAIASASVRLRPCLRCGTWMQQSGLSQTRTRFE